MTLLVEIANSSLKQYYYNVIYTSDQGFYLGEHGWFDKRFMYEESFRTPLLMRYPKEIKPGTVIDKMGADCCLKHTKAIYSTTGLKQNGLAEKMESVQ